MEPPPAKCTGFVSRKHSDTCGCKQCVYGLRKFPRKKCDCDYCVIEGFDLDPSYGPKSGITRLSRLERARFLGIPLDPKTEATVAKYSDHAYPF